MKITPNYIDDLIYPHPLEDILAETETPVTVKPETYIVVMSRPDLNREVRARLTIDPDRLDHYLDIYEKVYGMVIEGYDREEDNPGEAFYSEWGDFMEELAADGCLMAG